MDFKEINARIQDIEGSFKAGEIDKPTATMLVEESLKEYSGEDKVVHFKDYKSLNSLPKHHIPTGIADFDDIIGGVGKGDIILITGDTGDGKSTFSRYLIRKFSDQKVNSLVFSYEETNEEFLSKFIGDMPDGYLPQVLTDKSPTWIEARILEAKEKYNIEVVFIDNLKGIVDYDSRRNLTTEIDSIMQRLKAIAIKYNIVLFLLAHIKKEEDKLIDKNSVKDSKTIVDTSSIGLALYRVREKQTKKQEEENGIRYTNYTMFYLIKNRYNGKYQNFKMCFHPESGLYTGESLNPFPSQKQIEKEIKIDW